MPDKFKIIEETETRLNSSTWVSYDGWNIRISQPKPGAGWEQVELSLPVFSQVSDYVVYMAKKYTKQQTKKGE